MVSIKKALEIISKNSRVLSKEDVSLRDAFQRILASDLKATMDWPPFNRSTMDGYAVKSEDSARAIQKKKELMVIDTVEAGRPSRKPLKSGEAMKIMTGGMIPQGADAVIMKEFVRERSEGIRVRAGVARWQNVSRQGEDFQKGQTILKKGQRVNEGSLTLLAGLGYKKVLVYRKPSVAVLVTGNELLSLEEKMSPGKIRSTNEYALCRLVESTGGIAHFLGVARDNPQVLRNKIRPGFQYDVLLVSGGMSVGDFDFVPRVLKDLGVTILFHGVSIQPGKPLLFGRKGKTLIFGLPGNPISSMVSFYKFVYPCLLAISGCSHPNPKTAKAILAQNISVPAARTKVLRGIAFLQDKELFVKLTSHQGSGNMLSMVHANCLFEIPEGQRNIKKGTRITIEYLP